MAAIRERDLYAVTVNVPLTDSASNQFGTLKARYEVHQRTDVANGKSKTVYDVECTVRVGIPNQNPLSLTPSQPTMWYVDYPAALTCNAMPVAAGANDQTALDSSFDCHLQDFAPRTLNTSISTSVTSGFGSTLSSTIQRTTGSSTSQSNTYGGAISLNASLFDAGITATADYSTSSSSEANSSSMAGSDAGTSRQQEASSQVSVKDWCSYGSADSTGVCASWVWAQEYPWNVLQYNAPELSADVVGQAPGWNYPWSSAQSEAPAVTYPNSVVMLPSFVAARLVGIDSSVGLTNGQNQTVFVTPPSELSLFGVDFVMKCRWQVDLPADMSLQCLAIQHELNYAFASHGMFPTTNNEVDPWIGSSYVTQPSDVGSVPPPAPPAPTPPKPTNPNSPLAFAAALATLAAPIVTVSPDLDLVLLGLDPIRHGGRANGAAIGFSYTFGKFIYFNAPPSSDAGALKIVSEANNLLVTGSGFDQPSPLTASFGPSGSSAPQLTIQFKVVDATTEYSLFLKHWVTAVAGCTLTITINPDPDYPGAPTFVRQVTGLEGQSGDNNLLEIVLRNTNFASIDYHDYLVVGTNTIQIAIAQNTDPGGQGLAAYQVQAIAIGSA